MSYAGFFKGLGIAAAVICGCVLMCVCYGQEEGGSAVRFGAMKADRILVLGNSITLHGVHEPYGWLNYCGMAASVPEKDYVHLLAAGIDARTGGHLRISPKDSEVVQPDGSSVTLCPNVINVADIFERRYASYSSAPLQRQLALKPDIVVLQVGENVPMEGFDPDAFKSGLRTLMTELKDNGNPHVFVTSHILGTNSGMDEIKRQVCAEDPAQRVFVDLSAFGNDPKNFASAEPHYTGVIVGHPGDKGMALIANALLKAMVAHADGKTTESQ